ncbi:a-factor receptor [Cytospora paraplurivora]|uniref:A-factor receptor n=1 Tax=Cytospora paraplurivora TaxID=2898453 RepID=A0AAN9U0Y3_9PEZI
MKLEDAITFVGANYGQSTGQLINIIFRCTLNLVSAVACWVPMRLFYRNGELAGTTMVIAIAILNFYYFVNALIWSNNNIAGWSKGYGWCDIQLASWVPLETLNSAAVCAILHNVSNQVALMRAIGLSGKEKRRKHLIQALIIFPIPVSQLILHYFVIAIRYNISGIVGCQAVFDVPFTSMYVNYVAVVEVIIFYLYFGRTKDAHDMYRRYLRALGLGKVFPKLNEEWFPSDDPPASLSSLWSRARSLPTHVSSTQSSSSIGTKDKARPIARPVNDVDDIQLLNIRLDSLDLATARSTPDAAPSSTGEPRSLGRSLWIFRTALSQHCPLPKLSMPAMFGRFRDSNRDMSILAS